MAGDSIGGEERGRWCHLRWGRQRSRWRGLPRPVLDVLKVHKTTIVHAVEYYPALKRKVILGFPGAAVVENLPANAGDTSSSPGLGRSHMPRSN